MTYLDFREHSSPLQNAQYSLISDLLLYRIALFMYDYFTDSSPRAFSDFFFLKK